MKTCRLIFVLNNKTEIEGDEKISEVLHLFPDKILEISKPIFLSALHKTKESTTAVVRVYQDGKIESEIDIYPGIPLNSDLV